MGTLEFQGDAEFSKRVESFSGEQVYEEVPSGRVVSLGDQTALLLDGQDAPLDQVVQHLRLGRVDFLSQNTFVPVKEPGDALPRPRHGETLTTTLHTSHRESASSSFVSILTRLPLLPLLPDRVQGKMINTV
jgi:hypothetical protein